MTMSAGSSSIIVDGDYVVRSGTTNAGSSTITINGNLDNSGTFNPGTSTVIFPADSALLGSTPPAFHTLRIESTLTAQPSTPITISGDLVNLGTFIHNDSPVDFNGSAEQHIYTGGTGAGHDLYAVTVSNTGAAVTLADNPLIITTDLTIGSGADFDINGHDITVGGTFDNGGTLTIHGDEALNLSMDVDSGRVSYVGDGGATADTYTIRAWGATDYYDLRVMAENGIDTFVIASDKHIGNTFEVAAGIYDASGWGTTINGLLKVSGGVFAGSAGAVDVNGDFEISGGTFDAPTGDFTVSGDWTNNGGTFNGGTGTVTFDGSTDVLGTAATYFSGVTISGVLTGHAADMRVSGDWTNNGIFDPNAGTVIFDGISAQSVSLRLGRVQYHYRGKRLHARRCDLRRQACCGCHQCRKRCP